MKGIKITLTDEQMRYLVRHFKDTDNGYLACVLEISETTLHRFARQLGLKKTKAHCRQMQREAAAAAKRSHLRNGTYPPKGYRIPHSEDFQFKPGHKESAASKRKRVAKAVASLKAIRLQERIRILQGKPQQTKLHLTVQPRQKIADRYYLKKRGYILDEETATAYYTETTRRATFLEKSPRYYNFQPIELRDNGNHGKGSQFAST